MSISCKRDLGSPSLMTSYTILKEFYGQTFHTHGIISTLPIDFVGKTMSIEVEVANAPIDHNLLLEHTWFYQMKAIASSVFHVMHFPNQGKIVTIDKLDYYIPNLRANASTNVTFFSDSPKGYASVGAGLFKDSSLLGIFSLTPLDAR